MSCSMRLLRDTSVNGDELLIKGSIAKTAELGNNFSSTGHKLGSC